MIGGPVTFLHNWADVTTSFTRIWSDTHYFKSISLPSFLFTVMIWFYSRLFVFASLIYSYLSIDFYVQSPIMQPIFGFLLSCLYVLHVYWFSLFMKMIAVALFKNKYEDQVSPVQKKQQWSHMLINNVIHHILTGSWNWRFFILLCRDMMKRVLWSIMLDKSL